MAHLRQSGPSFEGLIDTLDSTTTSNSAVSITDQKHMYRVPSWKTGNEVNQANTNGGGQFGGSFGSLTHTDFPNTGDQISMSDYRSIVCNIENNNSFSYTTGVSKAAQTTILTGFADAGGMALASSSNSTSALNKALSEGTTYTNSPIPLNGNYGSSGYGSGMSISAILFEATGFVTNLVIVFRGSGAHSLSAPTLQSRGTRNVFSQTSTGPDGTWNQNNTSTNGGYNLACTFNTPSTVVVTNSSGASAQRLFRYQVSLQSETLYNSGVVGTGMNFTIRFT